MPEQIFVRNHSDQIKWFKIKRFWKWGLVEFSRNNNKKKERSKCNLKIQKLQLFQLKKKEMMHPMFYILSLFVVRTSLFSFALYVNKREKFSFYIKLNCREYLSTNYEHSTNCAFGTTSNYLNILFKGNVKMKVTNS